VELCATISFVFDGADGVDGVVSAFLVRERVEMGGRDPMLVGALDRVAIVDSKKEKAADSGWC
jgi:hypothetical protein